MSLSLIYSFKRLVRSWKLFVALLLGIVLASTFFSGINVGADTAAKQALDEALSQVPVDFVISATGFQEIRKPLESLSSLSSQNVTMLMDRIESVDGIQHTEAVSRLSMSTTFPNTNETFYPTVTGISASSNVYGEVAALNENETFVWDGSDHASSLRINDILSFNMTWYNGYDVSYSVLNFTVAGFVKLSDQALMVASGQYYGGYFYVGTGQINIAPYFYGDLFIANWEKTFARIIDSFADKPAGYSSVTTDILVQIDRSTYISPWDVGGSLSRLDMLQAQINDQLRIFNLEVQNSLLTNVLASYQATVLNLRFLFIVTSFPVFLVAWYIGSTVSDVSFNLRRREIGLLLTKGFSRRQLLQMFFTEAIIVGLVGGLLGIMLSLLLNPVFVRAVGGEFSGTPFIGTDTAIITVVFSLVLTFLACYQPARRASKLAAVDALREYLPGEDVKPYKRFWPWLAFGLGLYKIIILLLGVSMTAVMAGVLFTGNVGLIILLSIAAFLDSILTYIGPFLFFWGCAKILIRGSLKFQELVAKAVKFLGDLGTLATKSVQRNPVRAASVAFLLASIIFYSVWVSGTLASEQDFALRNVYFQVGADVKATFRSPQNASLLMRRINENLSDVLGSSTLEYNIFGSVGPVVVADARNWLNTAYYETEFFIGNDAKKAFELLASDNYTIILERGYGEYLKKNLGDEVSESFGKDVVELKIVGFFGRAGASSYSQGYTPYGASAYYSSQYWSFISESLFQQFSNETKSYSTASLLIKLKEGADGKLAAERIRDNFRADVSQVSSVSKRMEEQQSNVMLTGQFNLLRLGVIFVVLASSIGTALVTLVSLRERSRETAILNVRGLSFSQLLVMLLTENLAVVTFAVLLGAAVGFIAVGGTVASSNVSNLGASVSRHMVFPFDTTVTILFSVVLVFTSTIIPVVFMAKRSGKNLERVVREV
jgi:ABC-type antimicrobial peptide transport system permease subunit